METCIEEMRKKYLERKRKAPSVLKVQEERKKISKDIAIIFHYVPTSDNHKQV